MTGLEKRAVRSELEQLKRQYRDRILPANHIITQNIREVVQAILDANSLGVIKSETGTMRSFSTFPGAFGAVEDSWDPDANRIDTRISDGSNLESNTREWELVVIDDQKTVNAAALPGEHG